MSWLEEIRNKPQEERGKYAKALTILIFAVILFVFIITGAGFPKNNQLANPANQTSTPNYASSSTPQNLNDVLSNIKNQVSQGWQNLQQALGRINRMATSTYLQTTSTINY